MKAWALFLFSALASSHASAVDPQDHPTLVCTPSEFKRLSAEGYEGVRPDQQIFKFWGLVEIINSNRLRPKR
jgi:hypothetical protein